MRKALESDFKQIIDELYDEIIIYDNNFKIVYVNQASERHYGMSPDEMIGQSFFDLAGDYWNISVLPYVYKTKKAVRQNQETKMGSQITTIAVPVFDDDGEIKYVGMSVRDQLTGGLSYNLQELKIKQSKRNENDFKLIYKSEKMAKIIGMIDKIHCVDASCLITGESGVGKSLIGKYIHQQSSRREGAFVHINCAAINNSIFESEIYGYSKGAFTGASNLGKDGYAMAANKGTLFLDEIAEIPLDQQAKLLQFIQDKKFYPVGSSKPVEVDVNIIFATNKDLRKMVEIGRFREDLYYRINVFEIEIPSLRSRSDDILILSMFFLNIYNKKYKRVRKFSKDVKKIFLSYNWPGNIRELSHVIERLVIVSKEDKIMASDLPRHLFDISNDFFKIENQVHIDKDMSYKEVMENFESEYINDVYHKTGSSRKLAEKLNISQSKANRLIQKYVSIKNES